MKRIMFIIFISTLFIESNAQFHTIQKADKQTYIILEKSINPVEIETTEDSIITVDAHSQLRESFRIARNKPPRTKGNKPIKYNYVMTTRLEGLSIKNLYQELLDNGIKHPKIVLAQAILETGWFKSSVCRNKGNLFGLTNPKTGEYYEFEHWKESVKAYRDKVQYKYKGGNYLLWLREIGYAEDPRYVSSLIKILEQHFL